MFPLSLTVPKACQQRQAHATQYDARQEKRGGCRARSDVELQLQFVLQYIAFLRGDFERVGCWNKSVGLIICALRCVLF